MAMGDRFDQLEMRRRQLLLRSERLRADLAADNRVVMEAIGGVDKVLGTARRLASPVLLAGGAALALGLFKRFRPVGFAVRGLAWISLAKRLLTVLSLIRVATASRRPPADPDESPR
jgi:hypothetical protein